MKPNIESQPPVIATETNGSSLSDHEASTKQAAERAAVNEADTYILELVRIFAKAVQSLARYQCQEAIDELERLPLEQQRSPWVMTLTGRACYEKLDYVKVHDLYLV